MRTGTIALNASGGRTRSNAAPDDRADERERPEPEKGPRVALELVAVPVAAAHAARHEADVVADVRGQRRVAEDEQGRERDERARPDDGVDGPRREPRRDDHGHVEHGHPVTLDRGDRVSHAAVCGGVSEAAGPPAAPAGPAGPAAEPAAPARRTEPRVPAVPGAAIPAGAGVACDGVVQTRGAGAW